MADVTVTPIAQRAKWAQQRTQYDEDAETAPVERVDAAPVVQRFSVIIEGTPSAIDRVLEYAERHVNVRGVY